MTKTSELKNAFFYLPKMFRTVWKTDRLYMIFILCETLCFALLPYPGLYLTKYALDALSTHKTYAEFALTCAGVLALGLFISILKSVFNSMRPNRTALLNRKLTNRFHLKCMELDYQLLAEKETQELQALASEYVSRRMSNTIWNFIWLFSGLLSFAVSFVIMLRISPLLLAATGIQTALNLLTASGFLPLHHKCQNELILKNRRIRYFDQTVSDYANAKDLRIFSLGKRFLKNVRETGAEMELIYNRQKRLSDINGFLNLLLSDGFLYLIYAVLGFYTLRGRITLGTFSLAVSNITILRQYFDQVSSTLTGYSETAKYVEYYEKFMSLESRFHSPNQIPAAVDASVPLRIEFRNVSFTYPGKKDYALKNFSLTVNGGEKILIVGENGAGKSTLVKLLLRLYDPDEGRILINGTDIKRFRYEEYLKLFTSVFQDYKLFAFSVKENITSFDVSSFSHMAAAAQKAGIADKINALPMGYDTPYTRLFFESGMDFSGGEQQKIALARAYYRTDALITILDEPTSALDPRAEYRLYEKFSSLIGNNTAFFISHRLSSARFCDKVLVIKEGEKAEFGTHRELMQTGGIYREMFRKQADYYV